MSVCNGTSASCTSCTAGFSCAGSSSQPAACACSAGFFSRRGAVTTCMGSDASCEVCGAGDSCTGGTAQPKGCTCNAGFVSVSSVSDACAATSGTCDVCPAGSSCAGNHSQPVGCSCDAGYFSASGVVTVCGGASASCVVCGAGNSCEGGPAQPTECTCGAGYVSMATSSNVCATVGGSCAACPAGRSCSGGGAQPVACSCTAGYYSPFGAVTSCNGTLASCESCGAGNSCAGGAAPQVSCACAAGYWSSSATSSGCAPIGDTSCMSCGAGYACSGGSAQAVTCACAAGHASTSETSPECTGSTGTCALCFAGMSCAGGGAQPSPCSCSAGYFSGPGAVTSCDGTADACEVCLAGYSCAGGAANPAACTCTPGFFSPAGVITVCNGSVASCGECLAGSSCAGGPSQPVGCRCREGWYSAGGPVTSCVQNYSVVSLDSPSAEGSCVICTPGYSCGGQGAQPRACECPAGRWSVGILRHPTGDGLTFACSCTDCPAGQHCEGGPTQPEACSCSSGFYSPSGVVTNCSGRTPSCGPCEPGLACVGYTAAPASCTCAPGYWSSTRGSSYCSGVSGTCHECVAGWSCAGNSSAPVSCMCEVGFASTSATSSGCVKSSGSCELGGCGPGWVCVGGSAQPAECTCAVGYTSAVNMTSACAGTGGTCSTAVCGAGYACAGGPALPTPCTCAAGYASTRGGSATCVGVGGSCVACSSGTSCDGGTAQPALCTCDAGYYSSAVATSACVGIGGTCTECIAGHACDGGYAQPRACTCLPGYFSPAGPVSSCGASITAGSCVACFVGFSCDGDAAPPHTCECAPGYYSVGGAVPSCAGTAGACERCTTGNYCDGGAGQPEQCSCAAGYFSAAGVVTVCSGTAAACSACAAGYACLGGTQQPLACSVGLYSDSLGAPSCTACPLGASTNGTTSASQADCLLCAAGYYSTVMAAQQVCARCAPGTWSSVGAPSCTLCPQGTYTAAYGTPEECTACFNNRFGPEGSNSSSFCSTCPVGTTGSDCKHVDASAVVAVAAALPAVRSTVGGRIGAVLTLADSGLYLVSAYAHTVGVLLLDSHVTGVAVALSPSWWAFANGSTVVMHADSNDTSASIAFTHPVYSLAIVNDGRFVLASSGGAVTVALGLSGVLLAVTAAPQCPTVAVLGDMNGDGIQDVLCGSGVVLLLFENASTSVLLLDAGVAAAADVVPAGDQNGDGVPDVLLVAVDGVTLVTLARDGSRIASALLLNYSAQPGAGPAHGRTLGALAVGTIASVGDVNGDGVPDLVAANSSHVVVAVVEYPQCARVVAADSGAWPGVSNGDTVTVQFSCGVVEFGAAIDANASEINRVVQFSSSLGASYTGQWLRASLLAITITNATGASPAGTQIGLLSARFLVCDRNTLVVAGSWGDVASPPRLLSAVARNSGGQWGLGVGDSVELVFNMDISARAVLRSNVGLGETAGVWTNPRRWLLTVTGTRGQDSPFLTRVDHFSIDGAVQSADLTSLVAPVSVVVGGSWGAFPPPRIVAALASNTGRAAGLNNGDTVVLVFDLITSMPIIFSGLEFYEPIGIFAARWWNATSLVVTIVNNVTAGVAAGTRPGSLTVSVAAAALVQASDLSSLASVCSAVVRGSWGNAIVSTQVLSTRLVANRYEVAYHPKRLSLMGGQIVSLALAASLGAPGDEVSATYTNERYSYVAQNCHVGANGDAIICMTVPGVGADFAWRVVILGVALPDSKPMVSYGYPVVRPGSITGMSGKRENISHEEGTQLEIRGTNFGLASMNALVVIGRRMDMPGITVTPNCSIIVHDVLILCTLPQWQGTGLAFKVVVGGQESQAQDILLTPYVPTVHSIEAMPLSTAGGTVIVLRGTYLGINNDPRWPALGFWSGDDTSVVFNTTNCTAVPDRTSLSCYATPGFGRDLRFQLITAPTGVSDIVETTISYAEPAIDRIAPTVLPTASGGAVTIFGSGFACGDFAIYTRAFLDGRELEIADVSCTALVVNIASGVGAGHDVSVVVAGRQSASTSTKLSYEPPVVTAVYAYGEGVSPAGVAFSDVLLVGAEFGSDSSVVTVTSGGAPCAVRLMSPSWLVCRSARRDTASIALAVGNQLAAHGGVYSAAVLPPAPTSVTVSTLSSAHGNSPLVGGGVLQIAGSDMLPLPPLVRVLVESNKTWGGSESCARAVAAASGAAATGGVASTFCTNVSWTAGEVRCVLPPSTQSLVYVAVVTVRDLASCALVGSIGTVPVRYDPPIVERAVPMQLDVCGGRRLTLYGSGFSEDSGVLVGGAVCEAVVVASADTMWCTYPSGVGVNGTIAITSRAYPFGIVQGISVAYLGPMIFAVVPSLVPAAGGAAVCIRGLNFVCGVTSNASVAVRIGGVACPIVNQSAVGTEVCVATPPGVGQRRHVELVVGGQLTVAERDFGYRAPIVSATVPAIISAIGGAIQISGANFGPADAAGVAVEVVIAGVPCGRVVRVSDSLLSCVAGGMPAAHAALVLVRVEGQWGYGVSRVTCAAGWYELAVSQPCAPCPTGASCAGLNAPPLPAAGFLRISENEFVPCVPPASCTALPVSVVSSRSEMSNDSALLYANCAPGYTDFACRRCDTGYHRTGSGLECVQCPQLSLLSFAGACIGVVLAGVAAGFLHRRKVDVFGMSIAVSLLQVCSARAPCELRGLPTCAPGAGVGHYWNVFVPVAGSVAGHLRSDCLCDAVRWLDNSRVSAYVGARQHVGDGTSVSVGYGRLACRRLRHWFSCRGCWLVPGCGLAEASRRRCYWPPILSAPCGRFSRQRHPKLPVRIVSVHVRRARAIVA